MSISSVVSRVQQIEAMIAAAAAGNPNPAASSTSFSQQLSQASPIDGSSGAGASTAPVSDTGAASSGGGSWPFKSQIDAAASKYNLDPALLAGLIKQESGFDPNATSGAGAQGLTQLMPGTAAALGVSNPLDPAQSIDAGAHYLREQLDTFGGDERKALAAYNAGPGAVQQYGGVPPYAETQNYVQSVMSFANQYRQQEGGSSLLPGPTSLATAA